MTNPTPKETHLPREEVKRRNQVKEYVVNSMRLEGVLLDPKTLDHFNAYARGSMSAEECFDEGMKRILSLQKNPHGKAS